MYFLISVKKKSTPIMMFSHKTLLRLKTFNINVVLAFVISRNESSSNLILFKAAYFCLVIIGKTKELSVEICTFISAFKKLSKSNRKTHAIYYICIK